MDAAARAELDALRRRAYGQDVDIDADAVAQERLAELEELARRARLGAVSVEAAPQVEGDASDRLVAGADDPASAGGLGPRRGRPSPRRRLILGFGVAVAVLAVVVAVISGPPDGPDAVTNTPTATPTAMPTDGPAEADLTAEGGQIIPLLINSSRGEFVDVSWRDDAPVFPADGTMAWAHPLGVHYGWALWVGRASSGSGSENCLLLTNGSATEAQCVPRSATANGPVAVSLAFDRLARYQRPFEMTPRQQVTFTWGGGAYMTMEITER